MLDSIKEVLITEEALRERVAELGKQISADYKGEDVVLVCVLKGAVVFFADLARAIEGNVALDFISCSSYGNSTVSSGVVRIMKDLDKPDRRTVDVHVDYQGFVIPDYFVVGYGLDYAERFRNLPYIGVLKEEVYTSK